MWIMQKVRSHGWRKVESRLEQRSRAPTVGSLRDAWSICRDTKDTKIFVLVTDRIDEMNEHFLTEIEIKQFKCFTDFK
jgi:hypothetical protein